MKVHEYQAKELLRAYGVPTPRGRLVRAPGEARAAAAELGGRCVLKAQVHAGGRGKAGGIRVAASPDEAERLAGEMLGLRLVTHQTGPQGVVVRQLLAEEALSIKHELYLGIAIDRTAALPVMIASEAGGVEIEEVAKAAPEKITKQPLSPATGFRPYHARRLSYALGLSGEQARQAGSLMAGLYRLFTEKDCSLVEVNPLALTGDGRLLALDAKVNFDDNALYRHPEVAALRDLAEEDLLELQASGSGISYIKLEGSVGCMVNGAGLAMATMDLIKLAGGEPANFLDVGGGASAEQVTAAFRILLADPRVRSVLVNIFGGITRCDVVAQGLIEATRGVELRLPVVVRLAGTNLAEGQRLLRQSGLNLTVADDLRDAAEKAVAAVKQGEQT